MAAKRDALSLRVHPYLAAHPGLAVHPGLTIPVLALLAEEPGTQPSS